MNRRAALVLLLGLSVLRAGAAVRLLEFNHYIETNFPPPGRTGREILASLCFRPPGECLPRSNACSIAPDYPDWEAFYRVRSKRLGRVGKRDLFRIESVTLVGNSRESFRYHPVSPGRVEMWRGVSLDRTRRELVRSYLKKISKKDWRQRLGHLEAMEREIAWHEYQHVTHLTLYFKKYQRLLNSPRFPRRVLVPRGRSPDAEVVRRVVLDRETRIRRLERTLDGCMRAFHRRELKAGTFSSLVGECACYGGPSCRRPLPRFPPPDFVCRF